MNSSTEKAETELESCCRLSGLVGSWFPSLDEGHWGIQAGSSSFINAYCCEHINLDFSLAAAPVISHNLL